MKGFMISIRYGPLLFPEFDVAIAVNAPLFDEFAFVSHDIFDREAQIRKDLDNTIFS